MIEKDQATLPTNLEDTSHQMRNDKGRWVSKSFCIRGHRKLLIDHECKPCKRERENTPEYKYRRYKRQLQARIAKKRIRLSEEENSYRNGAGKDR